VQPEHGAAASRQLDQIKSRRPPLFLSATGFLCFAAEIPDVVHRPCQLGKLPGRRRIFDAVAIREDHRDDVWGRSLKCKILGGQRKRTTTRLFLALKGEVSGAEESP
jgi:hypothetical protein